MFSRRRLVPIAVLGIAYLAFLSWYGGSGQPLSAAESEAFMARFESSPSAAEHPELVGNLRALMAKDDGKPLFMVNLERVRPGPEAQQEDRAYARAVMPPLLSRACFPVFVGTINEPVLGNPDAGTSRVAIVRYRSLRDFMKIFTDPGMAAGLGHKFAAISETDVMATRPVIAIVPVRTLVGLIFLLAGVLFGRMAATAELPRATIE